MGEGNRGDRAEHMHVHTEVRYKISGFGETVSKLSGRERARVSLPGPWLPSVQAELALSTPGLVTERLSGTVLREVSRQGANSLLSEDLVWPPNELITQ